MEAWNRGILSHLEFRTSRGRLLYAGIVVALILLAVFVGTPFLYAFTAGLKQSTEIRSGLNLIPANPNWANYALAWERFNLPRLFGNTIVLVVGGLALQLFVSLTAAYSLSKLKPIGGRYIMMGFLLTLMIPGIAYLVPQYVTVARLNLLNNYLGVWLPDAVNAFMIFVLKNFFDTLPGELFDAAKVDGASAWQTFYKIALPLSRPVILVLSILTFVGLWKSFVWPLLVLLRAPELQPIIVRLYMINESSPPPLNVQMAGYFLAMLPPLLIAIVLQRYLQRGLSIGAVKG
jgi:multiple sugar transport system permease protein